MKIIFARTEDDALQLVSLCHPEEVELNRDFWREKYGADAELYALDQPGWELTQADVDDGGEAATRKASELIIETLQRISRGEIVAELEALDWSPPAGPPESAQKIDAPPAEPDIAPVKYVIWQGATSEFLAKWEAGSADAPSTWSGSPANAQSYAVRDEAESAAQFLVVSHCEELTVCALHETASLYWKEPLRDFFRMDSTPSLN